MDTSSERKERCIILERENTPRKHIEAPPPNGSIWRFI